MIDQVHHVLVEVRAAHSEEWLIDLILHLEACQGSLDLIEVFFDLDRVRIGARVMVDVEPVAQMLTVHNFVASESCRNQDLVRCQVNRNQVDFLVWGLLDKVQDSCSYTQGKSIHKLNCVHVKGIRLQ